jgi:hypothetical protein
VLPLLVVILGQFAVIVYTMTAYARDRADFLATLRGADTSARSERADLLQRIQAPEIAVVSHAQRDLPEDPAPLPFDDDEAFRSYREELMGGPSREEMVAQILEENAA